ncbi:trace amine-associated receptor 7e-like [Oculina patagonica]
MNISCLNERLSSTASIVLSLWFSLSGLAAVIGNAVVLWLFYKNESLRTISNRFLASLSVADFLVGLVIAPTWIAIRVFTQPQRSDILLKVIDMLWIHSTAATVFNLCCVSVDRYIAIRFSLRCQDIITKKRCYTVITMVWLISLFLPLCRSLLEKRSQIERLWFSLTFIIFLLPIIVVTLCYFWIFKVARKQARRISRDIHQNFDDNNTPIRALQNYKAIKTIGFVLGVFIVSWMPSLLVSLVDYFTSINDQCYDYKLAYVVWPWIEAIALTSSAINPWIYCFRNGEFREALHRSFHWFPLEVTPEFNLETDQNECL